MNIQDTETLMVLMRRHGVIRFKSTEVEIEIGEIKKLHSSPSMSIENPEVIKEEVKGPETGAAIPPVEITIPHHENQVAKLLKLSDEELVDRLFPEGPQ